MLVEDIADPAVLEEASYTLIKQSGLSSKEAFLSIYRVFLHKDSGPKAAWLLSSLDPSFVTARLREAAAAKGE